VKFVQIWCVAFAILAAAPDLTHADQGDEESVDFELPGSDAAELVSDLILDDADFTGNPGSSIFENWPEDLVIAPVPGASPQIGWNLTLVGAYFLDSKDEDSEVEPSALGGFVMGAENGSHAYGGGANLRFLDDKLRVKGGAAYADIRYKFYGIGNGVGQIERGLDINQSGPLYFVTGSWRVWNKLYVGLGYLGGTVDSTVRFDLPGLPPFNPILSLDMAALHIPVEFDSRDQEQFPMSGWLTSVKAMLYRKSLGGDFNSEVFKFSTNHYRTVRERDVLATRFFFRMSGEDAPFFLLSTFGGSKDLRGYPSGRYRDRMMYAMQTEYRWHVKDRWILTGFVGFGEVADAVSSFGKNILPAGGIGARFVLSEKHRVSLSADIATGKDGTEFYFGVGEAF